MRPGPVRDDRSNLIDRTEKAHDHGIEATQEPAGIAPGIVVLVLTMDDQDGSLFAAILAGARGYLIKGAEQEQIVRAIRAVVAGEAVFGSGIAERAPAYFSTAPPTDRAARPFPDLTDREVEVLRLLADGLNNTAIARRLFLSDKTIRHHIATILTELHVTDRAQAMIRARESGLND